MGRAPCCDNVGLKKGPWTPQEDHILISFIEQHGHSNWRALPKQAGLLRCGKSCRLRWINYLRPDIKRGNFSREEEDAIIQLHEKMGNRWSAIAAKLPGRTDNEIKNVWHTHLKKRLKQYEPTKSSKLKNGGKIRHEKSVSNNESTSSFEDNNSENSSQIATSPQQSYTISEEFSSGSEVFSVNNFNNDDSNIIDAFDNSIEQILPIIDETFWESQELLLQLDENNNDNNQSISDEYSNFIIEDNNNDQQFESLLLKEENFSSFFYSDYQNNGLENNYFGEDNTDFWLDVFVQAGGAQQL